MQPAPYPLASSKHKTIIWSGIYVILLLFIAGFRYQFIDLRPVHTDEAENAWLLANDLMGNGFEFNPSHHHGPTLHVGLKVVAWIAGFRDFAGMDMHTLRVSVWILGIATLVVLCFVLAKTDILAALVTLLLAGISGYLTYYSNYVIHETLLGFLAMVLLLLFQRFCHKPGWKTASAIGFVAGLMFATKITSMFYFASWGIAAVVLVFFHWDWLRKFPIRRWVIWFLSLILCSAFSAALVYTNGFQHPIGMWDAIRSIWIYHTEPGHAKPWYYFWTYFILPLNKTPFSTYEWGLWGFALIGSIISIARVRRKLADWPQKNTSIFLIISAGVQFGLYSLVAYKSPWLLLTTWLQVALLAGLGFIAVWNIGSRWIRFPVTGALLIALVYQWHTTTELNKVYHSDPRNPLAYAPTSINIESLPAFLEHHFETTGLHPTIAVYGTFIWPLPWYLRSFNDVQYSPIVLNAPDTDAFILTDDTFPQLDPNVLRNFGVYPFTLRPNIPVYVCLPKNEPISFPNP